LTRRRKAWCAPGTVAWLSTFDGASYAASQGLCRTIAAVTTATKPSEPSATAAPCAMAGAAAAQKTGVVTAEMVALPEPMTLKALRRPTHEDVPFASGTQRAYDRSGRYPRSLHFTLFAQRVTRLERRLERRHQECRAAYGCGTDGVVRRGAATTKHPTPYSATQRYAWR